MNKKYPIYLQSKKNKISLVSIEILKGEFKATQVVFKPTAELIENETYYLNIDNLTELESPHRFSPQTKKWEKPAFKISGTIDTEAPVLKGSITEVRKTMHHFGCGRSKWVCFNIGDKANQSYMLGPGSKAC